MTGPTMMYQLDCGHKGSCSGWPPAKPRCDKHGDARVYSAVIAIECREYKTTCFDGCHWARWYGQDKDAANLAATKHPHRCNVDYLRHPKVYRRMRREWPRRIKPFIIDRTPMPVPQRFPRVQHPTFKFIETLIGPNTDVPPF